MLPFITKILSDISIIEPYSIDEVVSSEAADAAIEFTTKNILPTLRIMGFGVLGVFVVIGVIILALRLMTKLLPSKNGEAG